MILYISIFCDFRRRRRGSVSTMTPHQAMRYPPALQAAGLKEPRITRRLFECDASLPCGPACRRTVGVLAHAHAGEDGQFGVLLEVQRRLLPDPFSSLTAPRSALSKPIQTRSRSHRSSSHSTRVTTRQVHIRTHLCVTWQVARVPQLQLL